MEFRVLGPVEAYGDDGAPVDLGGPRQRAVLARLLAARGVVVSTDMLIDDVYENDPPASALATIQAYVSHLRRAVEPDRAPRAPARLLVGRPPGYALVATDVDAIRFTKAVAQAESIPPDEALTLLDGALRLWRGQPYGEFTDEPWAASETNRLRELRLVAVERRAEALLALGRPQTVITDLEAETAAYPLRERLWCLLALSLYRTGRQGDALAVLRHARRMLADQLGLDPGPELRTMEDDILRQADSLAPLIPARPAVPSPIVPPPPVVPTVEGLVGRERELGELAALVSRTARPGPALAAVTGEPGIGKTRLLEAFDEHCTGSGHLVLWGRCHDTEGAPPLWPWLQVLGALDRICPPRDRTALAGLLEEETPRGSGGTVLLRRNQAVADWLTEAARPRPLVIVLDDLHWADPASLELLRDLVVLIGGSAPGGAVTLVAAFRDTEVRRTALHHDAPGLSVSELLTRLARYDLLRLHLTGLAPEAVLTVAESMGGEVDEPTARALAERTGGNPFFVRESARMLAQGRSLDTVPDAVADLIRWRIDALGPRTGEVLTVAAVVGRDFDPAVVAAGHADAYEALDGAERAGLVVAGSGRMAFAHDLIRETLLADVAPMRKAALHREVMDVLSRRPGTDVAVIAHHAVEAGPTAYAEAVRWARAAAEQASLRLAYAEAAMWWGHVVAAHGAREGDPAEHVELLLCQVRALLEAGDALGARQARAAAVRAADRAGAGPETTARALTALDAPSVWTLRNPYEAVELRLVHRFEAALRELPETDSPERARLLGGLAQELYDGTDDPSRAFLSFQAIEMARRLRDPHLLMAVLNARYLSLPTLPSYISEYLGIAEEILELAVRTQAPAFELLGQMMLTHHKLEMGDLTGADRAATCCDALLERLPLPWPRFQHTVWRAARLALAGRFDDAEILYDEAGEQAERIGMWYAGAVVATGRMCMNHQRGTMADVGPLVEAITGIHASMDHDARVLHLCARGRVEEARELVSGGWPTPPADWSWLTMTCLQGAAQAAVGDVPACQVTYSALLPYSGRISVGSAVASLGPVDWFLALLASALGDHDACVRHLKTVGRLAGQTGLMVWRDRAMAAVPGPSQTRPNVPFQGGTVQGG
ncbi:DNA-binding SARP family transcriptional activator [Streptosporangium becharense]|uniref:DNA-binding SARP family transcriptional activator n=1 Tax=Streptosporangium becharense TaxID=1816182 RepID=A0A7W9MEY9_9ACTN|nr:BTAD domain-containing putative transcriptional regulator [Streptosporangium becharense]MBB2912900.1 DNA-binding SARP family transcriptional activator [Streptosporangium becharense]MBB5818275.1 DNA-binding SARP family transcriptional activator [Streptosporangium becharense]